MNTNLVRKSTLWLATFCTALMLALPLVVAGSSVSYDAGRNFLTDPGGGHNGG